MASRYFRLVFSTIGALGFGLVAAAIIMPENFAKIFNPDAQKPAARIEAVKAAETPAPLEVENKSQNTVTNDLPQTKDAVDLMADALKEAQAQQEAEVSAAVQGAKPQIPVVNQTYKDNSGEAAEEPSAKTAE